MPNRARITDDGFDDTALAGAPPWAQAMMRDHALMRQTLGKLGEDGKSGTGLVGAVAELTTEMKGLLSLKNRGIGILSGALFVVVIVVMGVKGAIMTFLGKG